jgi:hypothetical protein
MMTRYKRIPQHLVDDDDDVEMQPSKYDDPPPVVSITVTRHAKPDGTIVRVKETVFSDGARRKDEHIIISPPSTRPTPRPTTASNKFTNPTNTQRLKRENSTNARFWNDDGKGGDDDSNNDMLECILWDDGDSATEGRQEPGRHDSLRIWPMTFWDNEQGSELLQFTVSPQYKLHQSSDSRLRVFCFMFKYLILVIGLAALIIAGTWFTITIMKHERCPLTYLRNVWNRPRLS